MSVKITPVPPLSDGDEPQDAAKKEFEALTADVKKLIAKAAPKAVQSIAPGGETLASILKVVSKEKGDKVVIRGSAVPDVERVPTGIFEFDLATGGGFPRGRISIVYGPESSGKTNTALKAIAYVQKHFPAQCNKCVFVDAEHAFDAAWAAALGVDTDSLFVVQPAYGEELVDVVDAVVRASDVALLVIDSLATIVSVAEVGKSAEDFDMGTSSILIKRMTNKLVIALAEESRKSHTPTVIYINQTRYKLGVKFGDPETMPGGQAPRFLSCLTVRLYGKNKVEKSIHPDVPAWKETHAIIKKAKVGVTAADFKYDMKMVEGGHVAVGDTDSWTVVLGYLKSLGLIVKSTGGWTAFGSECPKLVDFQELYLSDVDFAAKCQHAVVSAMKSQKFLVKDKNEVDAGPGSDNDK